MAKKKTDLSIVTKKTEQSTALRDNDGVPSRPIEGMRLTLEKLDFFDFNPRQSENIEFENIKESIRSVGLKNRLCVTKRPGDDTFILSDGGNTRLRALKELFAETNDNRFNDLKVDYTVFTSNSDLIIRHMVENEERGEMIFFDKAKAAQQIQKAWLEENPGQQMTSRKLVEVCKERGWSKISFSLASLYMFCMEYLDETIPNSLNYGDPKPFGKSKIILLRKHHNSIKKYAQFMADAGLSEDDALNLWYDVLKEADDSDVFDLRECWSKFAMRLADILELPLSQVETQLNHTFEHGEPYDGKVKYIEVPDPVETVIEQGSEPVSTATKAEAKPKQTEPENKPEESITAAPKGALGKFEQLAQAQSHSNASGVQEEPSPAAPVHIDKPIVEPTISSYISSRASDNGRLDHTCDPTHYYRAVDGPWLRMEIIQFINKNANVASMMDMRFPTRPPFFQVKESLFTHDEVHNTLTRVDSEFSVFERYFYYRLLVMWVTYHYLIKGDYDDQTIEDKNLNNVMDYIGRRMQMIELYTLNCSDFIRRHAGQDRANLEELAQHIRQVKLLEYNFERFFLDQEKSKIEE